MLSLDQVKVKGVGFDGIVSALRPSFEKSNALVPAPLQHYFGEKISPEGWYSLSDYLALMKILASQIDPKKAKGDVYRAFGVTGLATLVRRALHLRERYYSRGYYTIKRAAERKLHITLEEFPPSAELCAVSTGFLTHVMRTASPGSWVERVSCRGNGERDCRWEIRFADGIDVKDLAVFQ